MNSIAKAALVGVAALAVFVSCGRDEIDVVEEVSTVRTVRFTAGMVDTKAQFGEQEGDSWPTLWTANDSQLKLSLNYATAIAAGITPSADYRSATFSANIDFANFSAPYTYYAVSPASAAQALSPSREAWKVTIPCEQTPTAGSVDEAGIIIAASSYAFPDEVSASEVNLQFQHLTAYGCMSLDNLGLHSAESVQAVEITTTTPIVGDWYWNTSGAEITDYGASSTLTLNTSSINGIWFACAPVSVGDEILRVNVFTNQGVFKKMTLFPEGCKFESGQAAIFTVDMDGADYTATDSGSGSGSGTGEFTLVTDASTLHAGDEVLIVYTAGSKAMGESAGNYRNPVDITISNGAISTTGDAVVLTLCAGNSNGTWAFKDGTNYLASQSSNSNYLQNATSINSNSSWTISMTSAGVATITAQAGSKNLLCYNTNSPRFSCYGSSSGTTPLPSIYRRSGGGGGVSADDPLLQESDYGFYLGNGTGWTLNPGAEQVTRSYDANGVETYTLIDPAEVEEMEIVGYKKSYVKGDSFTVSVHWRKGVNTLHSDSYTVALIKEAGPKVWLSAGNGVGFIIKK